MSALVFATVLTAFGQLAASGATVATPTFNPAAGTFTSPQTVTITTTTSGASIRYTTNGSTPSSTVGTLYTGPISIGATTTLKAIAYKSGSTNSSVRTGTYTINLPTVATPSFSPVAGTYTSAQTVVIATTTSGASIRYTTDGSTPSSTVGTLYTGPVGIGATTTLKAIAYKSGSTNSSVRTGTYTINLPTVATPSFSPVAGTYTSAQTVAIATTTSGASIRYTTDGSTPSSTAGTLYSTPVSIGATTTLKAIAFKTGMTSSAVTSGIYTINLPVAAPSFSPVAGTYTGAQTVTITTTTSGASIRYTTNGTTPSSTVGTLYSGPVSISATTTLKAIAYKTGLANSTVTTGVYTLNVVAPTFSPVAGTYTGAQTVTITSTTSGASIRYTTDGSTPSSTIGTLYSSPVSIGVTTTLKAIAYKAGMSNSTVTTGDYTLAVAPPTFTPAAGTFTSAQTVTITSTTSGASIRYTTDGSTPSSAVGTPYSAPVSIGSTSTLQAIAYKAGLTDSNVTNGLYTINLPVAATPAFSPGPGTYASTQTVTITSTTSGASIAYTTDGSTPTQSDGTVTHGTLYMSPVTILGATTTLNAIAFRDGYLNSLVASGVYTNTNPLPLVPILNPTGGTYTSEQTVTIASDYATSIYYTTDGSTPTASSMVYTGALVIANNTFLQAVGINNAGSSPFASASFTVLPPAPVFSPGAGAYANVNGLAVTITVVGTAPIYYTTNGATPTSASTLYTGQVSLPLGTTVLSAVAINANGSGPVTARQYVLTAAPPLAPVLSLQSGSYDGSQLVTIGSSGATSVYYTMDGSTPNAFSALYSGPVAITASATLKAVGVNGSGFSPITTGTYTITGLPSAAVFSPAAGTYGSAQTVAIASLGATSIYYTSNGSVPTPSSTLYTGPIAVHATQTLQAVGVNGYGAGAVASGNYTILQPTTGPVFNPAPAIYAGAQSIAMSSASVGATIRYTTDGSTPTASRGSVYSAPVNLANTTMLRAVAYAPGMAASSITNGNYTIGSSRPVIIVLYDFTAANDGPVQSDQELIQASDGNFYGITNLGGTANRGAVFKVTPTGVLTTLASMPLGTSALTSRVVEAGDGNFYGVTSGGGSSNNGIVYRVTPSGDLTTVASFTESGAGAGFITGTDGNLYGTSNLGTVFRMSLTGDFTTLASLPSGQYTKAALVEGGDGDFYGTTRTGGTSFMGTVFKVTPAGVLTTLVSFSGANGRAPTAPLIQGADGDFYGTTEEGGSANEGTAFRITSTGVLTTLASFNDTQGGSLPYGGLAQGLDGNFYGTVYFGGTFNNGAVFQMTPAGVLSFTPFKRTSNGGDCFAGLVRGTDGNFYGTTYSGGLFGYGVIFQVVAGATAAPIMSPAPGSYSAPVSLTMTTSTSGATIRYTIDGSVPTNTHGTVYSGPVQVTQSALVQVIALSSGIPDSPITRGSYVIVPPTASPVISPASGTYTSPQSVSVTCATPGATIRYTTNGTMPAANVGTIYTVPFVVSTTATVRAIAYQPGFTDSSATTATYTISPIQTVATPVFGSGGGNTVTITSATPGATIRYTLDGSAPTPTFGTIYVSPVPISAPATLRAIAYKDGFATSAVASVTIAIPTITIETPADGSTINN